jgi:hypothetical protein
MVFLKLKNKVNKKMEEYLILPILVIRASKLTAKQLRSSGGYRRYKLIQIYKEGVCDQDINELYELCNQEMLICNGRVELI